MRTQEYIAPFEVVVHNKPDDCWLSFLHKVIDVTQLIEQYKDDRCVKPLLAHAGKDVSHWFDERDGELVHRIHPVTGVKVPYLPHGMIPHVPTQVPSTKWRPIVEPPWWRDERYVVGRLTKRVRPVRIINTLISKEVQINVCCEDTINRILERYLIFNKDATSYTWRYNGKNLKMDKNLVENEILDERDDYTDVGLPQSLHVPGILLYYNDDLKWEDLDREPLHVCPPENIKNCP